MSIRSYLLSLLLCVAVLPPPLQAAEFATPRLRHLASCLHLTHLDTLHAGTSSPCQYRGHELIVRRAQNGEVEHIGLRLFPDELRTLQPSPIYDFLERNLLERNLKQPGDSLHHVLTYEHVTFLKGNAATALALDGSETFSSEQLQLRSYRVTWQKQGRDLLRMTFDMDLQLLSGCNAPQLETIYLRRLQNYKPGNTAVPTPVEAPVDTFYTKEMRHELFWEDDGNGGKRLVDSPSKPTATLYNMMLATQFDRSVQLDLTFDRYGYATDQLSLPLSQWLLMGQEEGCQSYFGIKKKDKHQYYGTLLMVNNSGGYAHLLSVTIPHEVLGQNEGGKISGRLYVYVPLHNVSKNYFK